MATDLSAYEIQKKINQVKKDIETIKHSSQGEQRIDIMYQYLEYLEYELETAKNKN